MLCLRLDGQEPEPISRAFVAQRCELLWVLSRDAKSLWVGVYPVCKDEEEFTQGLWGSRNMGEVGFLGGFLYGREDAQSHGAVVLHTREEAFCVYGHRVANNG